MCPVYVPRVCAWWSVIILSRSLCICPPGVELALEVSAGEVSRTLNSTIPWVLVNRASTRTSVHAMIYMTQEISRAFLYSHRLMYGEM